jgi:hypothetical protein
MYSIVAHRPLARPFRNSLQLASLNELLPDADIEALCRKAGHVWRRRQLPPGPTVRSMVYRGLHADHSIAAVLADLAALSGPDCPAPTDSAWCQARDRLPEKVLTELIGREAWRVRRHFGQAHRWHGRPVFIADGTTVSMPDEPALVQAFGYTQTRHGRSRFPVARMTLLELAGLEVIWNYRLDRYTCGEDWQLHGIWHTLPLGCICLLDRKFCSFYNLAMLRRRCIDGVCPLHQRRDPHRLIAQGYRLGSSEWIVPLDVAHQLRRRYADPSLPPQVWVRLLRVKFRRGSRLRILWLVTTLLDRNCYPRRQIARLYRRRWGIETRIGSVKTTLEMNVLRSKSPAAIRREVAAVVLGHNLVWRRIHEASQLRGTASGDISFAGAVKVVLAFSAAMLLTRPKQKRLQLQQKMLIQIARQTNHHPFDRVEPRLIKRETARFAYLREPRWKARLKCLS